MMRLPWFGFRSPRSIGEAANILAARFLASRLDLSAERLYTLSPGTRPALASPGHCRSYSPPR